MSHDTPLNTVTHLWRSIGLPDTALASLDLPEGDEDVLVSSFKVAHLAQATAATCALAASTLHAARQSSSATFASSAQPPRTCVTKLHAAAAFCSHRLARVNGCKLPPEMGVIGGLYATRDGYVRVHDSFAHHGQRAIQLLGCEGTTDSVAAAIKSWNKVDLEEAALEAGALVYAVRTPEEFGALGLPPPSPISLTTSALHLAAAEEGSNSSAFHTRSIGSRPLSGLRVLDLTRVIAGPVAGRALAALGADVVWITSPNLPTLPGLDVDMSRGKRRLHVDLDDEGDREKLKTLVKTADVIIQSYRPGALERRGFGSEEVRKLNPGIVYASLSAWGPGPWASRRGFDALVCSASGIHVGEAAAAGEQMPKPLPTQALDHGAGYLLATGIIAALYHRHVALTARTRGPHGEAEEEGADFPGCQTEKGAVAAETRGGQERGYDVDVSLASVMELLKTLGRRELSGKEKTTPTLEDAREFLEITKNDNDEVSGVTLPASIEGVELGLKGRGLVGQEGLSSENQWCSIDAAI